MDVGKHTTRQFFTAAEVRGLKPEAKVYEASDARAQGLICRVQPSGSRKWFYRYREPRGDDGRQGKLHRIEIGEYPAVSLDAARTARNAWAARRGNEAADDPHEYLAQKRRDKAAQEAIDAAQANAKVWTVARLGEEFIAALAREGKRPRTIDEAARQLRKDVYPVIGETSAADVRAEDILAVLHKIEKRGAMRLRNAVRVTMRWLFSWAAEDGPKHLRQHPNPVASTRRKKDGDRPNRERRAYTDTELKKLWPCLTAATGDVYADALSLALLCGTRAEETVSAHWRDIDLDAGTDNSRDRDKKSAPTHSHSVTRSQATSRIVDVKQLRLRAARRGRLRTPVKTLRKRLRGYLSALDLDASLTVHELRHTVCTFVERRWA